MAAVETVVRVCGEYFGADVGKALRQMEEERIAFLYRAIGIAHAQ
jgi:hypothetical protein